MRVIPTVRGRAGLVLLAAALTAAAAPPGHAQRLEISAAAGRYAVDLDAPFLAPGVDDGWGFDGALHVRLNDHVRIGAGAQYNAHAVGGGSDRYEVVVPFVEARVVLVTGTRWEPFLAARLGAVRHSLRVLGQDVTGTGRVVGGLTGVGVRLSPSLELVASGAFYHATVENVALELGGVRISPDDLSAEATGARLALVWRPGA